jgi:hypothetical protein
MSEFAYQNPKEMSSESVSLSERVFLTSQINLKGTWEFFYDAFTNISQSHEDISHVTG